MPQATASKEDITTLRLTIADLTRRLDCVYMALGLDLKVLPLDRVALLEMVQRIVATTAATATRAERLEWARTFFSVTPEYIELLHVQAGVADVWRDLLRLADALQRTAGDVELERLTMASRRNLQHAIYLYLRRMGYEQAHEAVADDRDVHDRVLAAAAR